MESELSIQLNGQRMKLFRNLDYQRLRDGLSKTREKFVKRISQTVSGKVVLDDDVLDQIEEILITSDVGYEITEEIINRARSTLKNKRNLDLETIFGTIQEELSLKLISNIASDLEYDNIKKFNPFVILVVGVNGSGKTTTIGKLAHIYKKSGLSVVIGSADTFRAAANEQLEIWAERAGVEIVKKEAGADPSSVAFETLTVAKSIGADIVLIDTAGRLHTKQNLMEELSKIKRVIKKFSDHAPNETFLVIDGNTGQNAIIQANEFSKFTELTGLVITKLDGTAKGGVIFPISAELTIPIRFIGVGEKIDDLQSFDPETYIRALFSGQ